MTSRCSRALRAFGVAALVVFTTPTVASAEDPATISACISREGRVRILSAEESEEEGRRHREPACHRGERRVTWNIAGPQGPPGPAGEPGEQGPPGPGFSGVQYYTVGGGDLRPVGGGFFATSFAPPPGGTFSAAAAPLMAGVHLPERAHVLEIRAHVFDSSTSDIAVELIEQSLPDGRAAIVASLASTGAAGVPFSLDAAPAMPTVVDNARFHYFIRVLPAPVWTASTLQVLGVTIKYTLQGPPGS